MLPFFSRRVAVLRHRPAPEPEAEVRGEGRGGLPTEAEPPGAEAAISSALLDIDDCSYRDDEGGLHLLI
jgi:hypothetical protein